MIQQILVATPIWVWAILAFLVYRGIAASTDRETSLRKVFIIPIVMLGLSLHGIVGGFGGAGFALLVWLAAATVGSMLSWAMVNPANVRAVPERHAVFLRGSWVPMSLMMGIFATKYAVGVTLAMHGSYRHDTLFVAVICALYGLFNGIFLGQLMRIVALYRGAQDRLLVSGQIAA